MGVQLNKAIKGALAKAENTEPPETSLRPAVRQKVSW